MGVNIKFKDRYYFYIFTLPSGVKKMGITHDLIQRSRKYLTQHRAYIDYDYIDEIQTGWVAYLYEQVLKYRCQRFMIPVKHEYFWHDVPVNVILVAYLDTKERLAERLDSYKNIHCIENSRKRINTYKQIAKRLGAYENKIHRNTKQFYF